jgi:hypothetical protein
MTDTDGDGNGNGNGNGRLAREGLTTSWLATRLGTQSARVEAMRRAGELLGVRLPGRQDHVYPAWQFDRTGKPLASVPVLIRAAREAGIDDGALHRIVVMRAGLTSGARRLVDELRDGNSEPALRAIRASGNAGSPAGPLLGARPV